MATETKQIILRKGTGTPITLAEAELGFATNTKTLFVGTGGGSVKVLEEKGHKHTKADITDFTHTHDDRYYTETEVNTLLSGKSDEGHGHSYASLSGRPTLGTISPINLPQNAAKYLRGDGSWADVPSGLANTEASFTLFSGAVTITHPNTRQVDIPTSVGLLKNAVIRIKFDAIGYTHLTEDVAVNGSGIATYYDDAGGQGNIINFSITFGLTQATFSAYFDEGEGQSYVLREITVMYNK